MIKLKTDFIKSINLHTLSDKKISCLDKYFEELNYFYALLGEEEDKKLFVEMVKCKLGFCIIQACRYNEYMNTRSRFDSLLADNSIMRLKSVTRKLKFYDLSKFGYNLKLYGARSLLDKLIFHNQYSHKKCQIAKGDYVIDAGGCWGDTALLFAEKTGSGGKVFSFEFFEESLEVMKRNFSYNPDILQRISIVKQPLYDKSNEVLYLKRGCADITTLTEKNTGNAAKYKTTTIDDFIKNNKIARINFIKMDIEGCEILALKGAVNTITKFKPKLAIAAYHKDNDFYEISKFINDLKLGYKFYFGNYTLRFTDTIIYAK